MSTENLTKIQSSKSDSEDWVKLTLSQAALLEARDAAIAQYKDDIEDNIKIFNTIFKPKGLKIKDFNQGVLIARKSEVVYDEMNKNQIMYDMLDSYYASQKKYD